MEDGDHLTDFLESVDEVPMQLRQRYGLILELDERVADSMAVAEELAEKMRRKDKSRVVLDQVRAARCWRCCRVLLLRLRAVPLTPVALLPLQLLQLLLLRLSLSLSLSLAQVTREELLKLWVRLEKQEKNAMAIGEEKVALASESLNLLDGHCKRLDKLVQVRLVVLVLVVLLLVVLLLLLTLPVSPVAGAREQAAAHEPGAAARDERAHQRRAGEPGRHAQGEPARL